MWCTQCDVCNHSHKLQHILCLRGEHYVFVYVSASCPLIVRRTCILVSCFSANGVHSICTCTSQSTQPMCLCAWTVSDATRKWSHITNLLEVSVLWGDCPHHVLSSQNSTRQHPLSSSCSHIYSRRDSCILNSTGWKVPQFHCLVIRPWDNDLVIELHTCDTVCVWPQS